jgi:hypothetical protein
MSLTEKWIKSSRSGSNSGQCVEVRALGSAVEVRDTKNRDGGTLSISPAAWVAFVDAAKQGEFDL